MKTFKEFILEAESTKPVGELNSRQVFHVNHDKKTQENLNNARRMGPGGGRPKVRPGVQPLRSVNFSLEPANIPMK